MAKNARGKIQPKMFYKDFDGWAKLAKKLDKNWKIPTIREGEVWWCSVGVNVGMEICGKSDRYTRPVLVLKKLSRYCFMGIPLTSKYKTGSWFVNFDLLGKRQTAVIAQAKVTSVLKLHDKIGELPEPDFCRVKRKFIKLYK